MAQAPGPMLRLLLAFGGTGYSPVAPGTVASILTAAIIHAATVPEVAGQPATALHACLALLVAGCVATLAWGGTARRPDGRGDPGWVVADEVAGQALASTAAVVAGGIAAHALALIAFRVFDILKPPPVKQAERLTGGLGVLADDLVAGALAALVVGLAAVTGLLDLLA